MMGGHPLQSALWGDARRAADGIEDERFLGVFADGQRTMIRLELRRLPVVGGIVGWAPRGPAGAAVDRDALAALSVSIVPRPQLIVTDEWREREAGDSSVKTIWVDLSQGSDLLWRRLDKGFRSRVSKARRAGFVVEKSRIDGEQAEFFSLMRHVSEQKDFSLAASPAMIGHLLANDPEGPVSAHLFTCRQERTLAAAGLVMQCGESIHCILAATDREASKGCASEALYWAIIEWGVARKAVRYDLEGIDPAKNPGTYAFKKKTGGREVKLVGKTHYALTSMGSAVSALHRWKDQLSFRG